jgi:hypothetical protein
MTNEDPITAEVAGVLAHWAGLRESAPAEKLAEVFDGVRKVMDRLYAVDVDGYEFDFLQPDSREP